jgi:hypothetical protein
MRYAGLLALLLACPVAAHAVELRLSPEALERTMRQQLFTGPAGRYYLRGNETSGCYVYIDNPSVQYTPEGRISIHVHAHSKLGESFKGSCVGIGLSTEADVSVLPDAEGETIGFRDARLDHLSEMRELNFLLEPFLSRKLPQSLKVNAAVLLRQLLTKSTESTGYAMTLDRLKIHSMIVDAGELVVDVDASVSVK